MFILFWIQSNWKQWMWREAPCPSPFMLCRVLADSSTANTVPCIHTYILSVFRQGKANYREKWNGWERLDSGREERFGRNVVTSHDRTCGRPQTSYKHQIVIPVRFLEGLRCIKKLMLCIAGKKADRQATGERVPRAEAKGSRMFLQVYSPCNRQVYICKVIHRTS